MNAPSDAQLLGGYANGGQEAAFRELVARHTDLVYSAALRHVEGADVAADIAQTVFVDLARKAKSVSQRLAAEGSLAGWLHRATRYAALNHLRDARRRLTYERQAMEQLRINSESTVDWGQIQPVLDEALDSLADADREALLLRYFKNQDLRAVGRALGVSDDAAQKRLSRAVERLREFFAERGITVSAGGLALLISANAIQAAPASLAVTISATALAASAVISTPTGLAASAVSSALASTATVPPTFTILKSMSMTKLKVGAIGALTIAAITVPLLQQNRVQQLSAKNAELSAQVDELARLREENAKLAQTQVNHQDLGQLRAEHLELLRLRGEVNQLRQKLQAQLNPSAKATDSAAPSRNVSQPALFSARVSARMSSGDTLAMKGWATEPGKRAVLLVTPTIHPTTPDVGQVSFNAMSIELPESTLGSLGLSDVVVGTPDDCEKRVLSASDTEVLLKNLGQHDVRVLSAPWVSTVSGVEASIQIGPGKPEEGRTNLTTTLSVVPRVGDDRTQLDVEVSAQQTPAQATPPGTNATPAYVRPSSVRGL